MAGGFGDPDLLRQSHGGRIRLHRPRLNVAIAAAAAVGAVLAVTLAYAHNLARLNWTPLPAASLAALDRCDGNL